MRQCATPARRHSTLSIEKRTSQYSGTLVLGLNRLGRAFGVEFKSIVILYLIIFCIFSLGLVIQIKTINW